MNYRDAKQLRDKLDLVASQCSAALQNYPRGPMGLTPDSVKQSPESKRDKIAYANAHDELRRFNRAFTKHFRAEIADDRRAKYAGRKVMS